MCGEMFLFLSVTRQYNMTRMKLSNSIFIALLLLLVPVFSLSALSVNETSQASISSEVTPETIRAYSSGVASISSSYINLDSSTIQWSVGGKVIKKGVGETEASFSVGPVGVPVTILVSIKTLNGLSYSQNIVVLPANIDFVTQAKTYTPPFYKGKAVFTGESDMTVTAFVDMTSTGGIMDPNSLIYEWSIDRSVVRNQSGYGKKSFTFTGTMWNRPEEISVFVSSLDGSVTAKHSEIIKPENPEIVVYEDNPLLGILFNRAVSSPFSIEKGKEVSLFAAPYNIISDLLISDTTYTWKMNRKAITEQNNGNSITFRDDTGRTGQSNISIDVAQASKLFQTASTQFTIQFK